MITYLPTKKVKVDHIPVLGSQPAGNVNHKPDGRLPLLSVRAAVTLAILKRVATNFAGCLVNRGTMGVNSLPKTVTRQSRDWAWVQHANHSATEPPTYQQSVFKCYYSDKHLSVFTYEMAAKINWHRYGTKLRQCHPKYRRLTAVREGSCWTLWATENPRSLSYFTSNSKSYQHIQRKRGHSFTIRHCIYNLY